MSETYDLNTLDPDAFAHMVNALALAVLGPGSTGFGPGPDGGRDGYFEGEAPYPSHAERWSGVWYIQSKFHRPHLSTDPQKWLLEQIEREIAEFQKPNTKRVWPDNWIVATNIDPSGVPQTGSFDRARQVVKAARPALESRVHIWGGAKIISLLDANRNVAERYGHFLTPGHLISAIREQLGDAYAGIDAILQHVLVQQFQDQRLTKIEQAGSQADVRPAIHELFVDLPFYNKEHDLRWDVMRCFTVAGNEVHRGAGTAVRDGQDWRKWARHPRRARVWFLKGGPGQGKSTVGQYYCQIQRAALLLDDRDSGRPSLTVPSGEYEIAERVRALTDATRLWPRAGRIPLHIELKDYAQWYGGRKKVSEGKGVLSFLSEHLTGALEQQVTTGTLKRALKGRRWVAVFDGLDEVPDDVKDKVAGEVTRFINQIAVELDCDLLSLCTSRPQGYSGQFRELDCASADLQPLPLKRALACAEPVISFQRTADESRRYVGLLKSAAESPAVQELLKTPLQAHILAVVVRDGERPPDRRWRLYDRFYNVIRRREANRDLPDPALAQLLRDDLKLLKTIHNRVGFRLHVDAETSLGAETNLDADGFLVLAHRTVTDMIEGPPDEKVKTLARATTNRLVLINTPESGDKLRFDIRQLQEFFAAECLYDSVKAEDLRERIAVVAGDAHWREVCHFLLSSLVENDRSTELSVAVDELSRLNDGEADGADRVLHRRAGKGALLVARLLEEGVLEQDRAVRQKFRECLAPMAAFANVARLSPLLRVSQEYSRPWLITFMLDRLRESACAENVGAAIVLAHVLPDGHPRVPEVVQFLHRVPGSYLNAVTESFQIRAGESEGIDMPWWFADLLVQMLASPGWSGLGAGAIHRAAWLCYNRWRIRGTEGGEIPPYVSLLSCVYSSGPEHGTERRLQFGNIGLDLRRRPSGHAEVSRGVNEVALAAEAPGLFGFIQRMLRYSEKPSRSEYLGIIRSLQEVGSSLFPGLQRNLCFPMPQLPQGAGLAGFAERVAGASDEEFVRMVETGEVQPEPARRLMLTPRRIEYAGPVTTEDILACYRHSPVLGLEVFAAVRRDTDARFEAADVPEKAVAELMPLLRADPTPLLSVPWVWPLLMDGPGTQAEEFRGLLFDACRSSLPYRRPDHHSSLLHHFGDLSIVRKLFRVFYEHNEPCILPYFADLLLSQMRVFRMTGRHGTSPSESPLPAELMTDIQQTSGVLSEMAADRNLCWSTRCSAALLLTFLDDFSPDLIQGVTAEFVTHCDSGQGEWLLEALVTTLTDIRPRQTASLTALLRDLFEACREDYCARAKLEHVLMVWRESSTAPVTSQGLCDKWLYRSAT